VLWIDRGLIRHRTEEVEETGVILEWHERGTFLFEEAGALEADFLGEDIDEGGCHVEGVGLKEDTWAGAVVSRG
jgi:hypothetical protein